MFAITAIAEIAFSTSGLMGTTSSRSGSVFFSSLSISSMETIMRIWFSLLVRAMLTTASKSAKLLFLNISSSRCKLLITAVSGLRKS